MYAFSRIVSAISSLNCGCAGASAATADEQIWESEASRCTICKRRQSRGISDLARVSQPTCRALFEFTTPSLEY